MCIRDSYPALASILFNLAVELKENLGVHIGFINLSGGVAVSYTHLDVYKRQVQEKLIKP